MTDLEQPKMAFVDAFVTIVMLASQNALEEEEVSQDPEVLGPMRDDQQTAFDVVEAFLKIHLYGDCTSCE